jgi:hypothetical protein
MISIVPSSFSILFTEASANSSAEFNVNLLYLGYGLL